MLRVEGVAKLRAEVPSVPIVVLTGLTDEAVARGPQGGAQGFVVKGDFPSDLLALRYAVESTGCLPNCARARNGSA